MTLSRRRFLETSALALATVSGGLAISASPAAAQGAYDLTEMMKPGPLPEISLGKADAPVTVIEYASMTCGHCANFHKNVFPYLKETYVDTGKVRLVLREFPLDPLAAAVSMLIRSMPQDKYVELTGLFFDKQKDWIDPEKPVVALLAFSKQLGFTEASFNAALADQKLFDGINQVRDRASKDFKVDGTPAFFVNGRPAKGIATKEELDKALAPFLK